MENLVKKIKILLSHKSQHLKNRLKLRKGYLLYFLFTKPKEIRKGYTEIATLWTYKNHYFIESNGILKTYINKNL